MKHFIWFFFHRVYAVLRLMYHTGKMVAKLQDQIAYLEVRAVTKKQLEDLEDSQGREATPTDFEKIPETKVEVSDGPQAT